MIIKINKGHRPPLSPPLLLRTFRTLITLLSKTSSKFKIFQKYWCSTLRSLYRKTEQAGSGSAECEARTADTERERAPGGAGTEADDIKITHK